MWSALAAFQFFEDSLSGDGLVASCKLPEARSCSVGAQQPGRKPRGRQPSKKMSTLRHRVGADRLPRQRPHIFC